MGGLLESHVRPGLAKSEGAKHKTVAGAVSDVVDNSFYHGALLEGATKVVITLGPEVNVNLKARKTRAVWAAASAALLKGGVGLVVPQVLTRTSHLTQHGCLCRAGSRSRLLLAELRG